MSFVLPRIATSGGPAAGLLRAEHFQMAYVTNDADAACELLGRQLGIAAFARLEGPNPEGGHVRAEFAWVGNLMFEVIEASGPGNAIFTQRLPQRDGFVLHHHHLGYLIKDQAEWEALLANTAAHGWAIPHHGINPLVEVCFVEVPGLPHLLEYLFATEVGMQFFNSVPRS